MLSIRTITSLLLVASTSLMATALPSGEQVNHQVCGTCNPISGQNNCDITTSCINTGKEFHCACRAGYKASKDNNDITKQFRLNFPHYEFLVFTPEHTVCDTLCDNHDGAGPDLCAEVPIYDKCTA
ncbi:hypothetical protein FQN54_006446 [Arachnomyces sp. PD_36]|nr:hypothetical protein FQN54_006446 [Arachnomyces sp. PD_36]